MDAADRLIARARLWQWTARCFGYPDEALLARLHDAATRHEIASIAALGEAVGAIGRALAALWAAADAAAGAEPRLPEEHTFLFARQVVVPPYESSYARPYADRTQGLAEVGGFYGAFGFEVAAACPDLPDHVGAELEFVAVLLAKEAYALAQGWTEPAEVTALAREKFLAEHLAPWLPAFAERLAQHARLPFYPAAARLAVTLLRGEAPAAAAAAGAAIARQPGEADP
ncbi:MAG: molecular chaperone TorD family protein [Chloroflexi bacterium]|nr:molecular chaperone TorD family protein [Chloroflexota bacterium]